jgi:predicted CoA-substrate-specific enzyme activase
VSESRYISLDIGSVSIKAAVFDSSGNVVLLRNEHIGGDLPGRLKYLLSNLSDSYQSHKWSVAAVTGSEARSVSGVLGMQPVNEIAAAVAGGTWLIPEARSILSIGGIRACFIRLMEDSTAGGYILRDSFRSSRCSSGSGMFVEQEAGRLNISLDQLVNLALQSAHPPIISGRCTVFAKTDITHRHQNGASLSDIAGAICQMIARNIAGELIKKVAYDTPMVFIGGVALNQAVCSMLRQILGLDADTLIVAPDALYVNAIGAYRYYISNGSTLRLPLKEALETISAGYRRSRHSVTFLEPLQKKTPHNVRVYGPSGTAEGSGDYLLGIDVGSTNTKVVCLARSGLLLESCSIPTGGQPLEAIRESFRRMRVTASERLPGAVGVTGSGRKYIGDIIHADVVVNEITAHAESAMHFDTQTDTVIDIGGQDAKFIRIDNGHVTQFEMNKVCSAGTGSFLEETSALLGLDVRTDFPELALQAKAPLDLGDRCTVFMNSELTQRQNQGFPKSDIAAGLAYSVVNNYLTRVVRRHKIGSKVSVQGGVAGNRAVVAALEQVLNHAVTVHPHHEMAGAIGAAIIAGKETGSPSRFKGYALTENITLSHESFSCRKCGNGCSINYIQTDDNRRLYFGGICDRYDEGRVNGTVDRASALAVRRDLLKSHSHGGESDIAGDPLGIPLAMHFTELLPFWTTFFRTLGEKFVLSPSTSREMLRSGSDISPSSSCLPLKIAYGHCLYLHQLGVKRLFVPSLNNMSFNTRAERLSHICPAAQAWPYTTASLLPKDTTIIGPTVRMALPHTFRSDIREFGKSLGYSERAALNAFETALRAQTDSYRALHTAGTDIIRECNHTQAVIFSRPYTFSDYQVMSRLQPILSSLNVTAIPFDMLPTAPLYSHQLDGMYWYFGKRYLQAARSIKSLSHPTAIFISTYGCGTDTLLIHLLRDALGDIPFLELEIDQHCDFTGLRTRLEAFYHSMRKDRRVNVGQVRRRRASPLELKGRRILVPQMSEHAFVCASALSSFGYEAQVMPLTCSRAMSCGKSVVNEGECLPCSMLAGDMLNHLNDNGNQPTAFFMISGDGPCRLGQYTYLLRKILDEKGYEHIPIVDMSQDVSFYTRLDIVSSEFKKRFWSGSVAVDLLHARLRRLRPLTDDTEHIDRIYRQAVQDVSENISDDKRLIKQLRLSMTGFDRIKTCREEPAVTIAVIGENFVRCNPVANQQVINQLESLGAGVVLPHLTEWIFYTNWTARLHCLYDKNYTQYYKMHLVNLCQKLQSYRLHRAVKGRLSGLQEPSVRKIFALASDYIPPAFEGETIISVGRTVDYFRKGVDGIIQVAPFGCLAGTIYETLSQRLSDDLNGLPILNLQFDGRSDELRREELESFVTMARNWKKRRKGQR